MADAQDLGPSTGPSQDPNQGSGEALAQNKVPRRLPKKRTKTGCLTCRRRRIKCGEEKPICGNCVKSKRVCEGYAQRVVFKNPLGIPGIPPPSNHQDPHLQQHVRVPLYGEYASLPPQQAAAAAQHPMLAPRPLETASTDYHSQIPPEPIPASSISHLEEPLFQYPSNTQPSIEWRVPLDQQGQQPRPTISADSTNYNQYGYYNEQSGIKYEAAGSQMPPPITDWSTIANQPYNTQLYSHSTAEYRYPQPVERSDHNFAVSEQFTPSPNAQVIYVEDEADDYFDVESDEEMVDQKQTEGYNQLNLIMASAGQDGRLRSFTTHLNEPNILASYRPSLGSSPLNNPTTARIFAHFIHSTGPSLSIFERHPTDSSIMLSEPVSPAKQGLWSYTLPLMALEHPALLQAILAIGSLHIAYLQNIPTTVSLKHYHYALKRIGRAVSLPTRRKQIGTLAATELLAYYEVMSADHSKWNSHVAGAAHLIREIDFASLTRDLRAHRHKIRESRNQMGWDASSQQYYYMFSNETSEDDPFAEKEGSIDQELIGSLLGRKISYDKFGHVEGQNLPAPKKHFSRKDIENLRIQGDLYWWYTKQDMMHSLISGDKLFIPFYQQGRCPPRAGIGRLDAIYGTADHLWLLLSRVTDFGYRDRKRKIKAVRSAGTEWRPGPGVPQFMARFARGARPQGQGGPPNSQRPPSLGSQSSNPGSRAPTGSPSSTASRSSPPSEGPPMYGMVPPKGPTRVPTSFVEDRRGQEQTPEPSDCSVETSYDEAEREWEEILVAMDTFVQAISRDFQPLPPDVTVAIDSPFGSALQYRTLTIAVIWGFYYTGRILLHRLHPCMPPAMMVAAGVAGPTTAEYAQIIGRLMAGIYYPQRFNLEAGSLSPTLGSSLTEMTVPVFFGAVQYNDATQRAWTVSKLREISRLTGWKSSDAIAGGCEKAWVIAAKHGRGPPYERSFILNRDQAYGSPDVVERDLTQRATEYNDDRRFVTVQPPFRAHVAFGLLSLESDMQSLEL